jgi:hypothetical protein
MGNLLFEEIVCQMLVAEKTLYDRYHVAQKQRIRNSNDRYLYLPCAESDHRKEHVLNDSRSSPVHLLHELPHSLIDNKIIFFFFDIASKTILMVEQSTIVDTA